MKKIVNYKVFINLFWWHFYIKKYVWKKNLISELSETNIYILKKNETNIEVRLILILI